MLIDGKFAVGVPINSIDWPDADRPGVRLFESEKRSFCLVHFPQGDWVVEAWEGREVARHNPKFISTIFWKHHKTP